MPQFSAEQEKAALSYLRTQARLMYDRKEKVSVVGASERPQQQQWQYMAEAEKKDRRSLLEQWMKIRTAVTAADKDAAAESLLSAAKNYDKGIIDVDPTSTGVVIKWADGRTLPIEYKTGDKDKSGEAWAAAGTALHGIEEQGELNRYKGAKFYNVTDAEWGNVGASYSMPPAQGEVDRVAIYNQTLGKTNDSPFGSEGTDASAPLQQMLSPLGITVTDTSRDIYGVRNNYVTIKLPNGEEIELPTKQWTPGGRQEQYRKLKSFLDENMLNDQGVLKMISGVGRRWG
jgi:endonuclease YncB( thermonuclease family)